MNQPHDRGLLLARFDVIQDIFVRIQDHFPFCLLSGEPSKAAYVYPPDTTPRIDW